MEGEHGTHIFPSFPPEHSSRPIAIESPAMSGNCPSSFCIHLDPKVRILGPKSLAKSD
jgi:hypothetical protein